jgi:hypothetical protein
MVWPSQHNALWKLAIVLVAKSEGYILVASESVNLVAA